MRRSTPSSRSINPLLRYGKKSIHAGEPSAPCRVGAKRRHRVPHFFSRTNGELSSAVIFNQAKDAVLLLNNAMRELQSPTITDSRARELLMNANLSGSFERNYGAAAGLLMAFCDRHKDGKKCLNGAIAKGVGDFFDKYVRLTSSILTAKIVGGNQGRINKKRRTIFNFQFAIFDCTDHGLCRCQL